MKVLNSFFNWLMTRRLEQIHHFMENPIEVQDNIFHYLIGTARHTEWGKKYHYSEISSKEQYKERVPISTYEDLYPFIERNLKGEQNILWPKDIKMFSKSSGTTNARSKFIPVSTESLENCHYKAGKDLIALHIDKNPNSRLFAGKSIAVGGSTQPNPFNNKTYCGDVSALILKNLPIWAEYMLRPGMEVLLMDKFEQKIEKMAQITAKENIINLSGVPTWTLVLLERVLEITGKDNISEVWPNLEVFTHGAVAFSPYREVFKKLIPNENMRYMEIYNASEGFFGIQDTDEPDEMLLMLDYGVYFEFIPMSEFDSDHPKTVELQDVEVGKNYAMVITTNGGLWRYMIGDTIKFTSKFPFRIKITGRTKHFINAFGEEVIIENAEAAITKACKETDATITNFTVAPIYLEAGKKGGHEWIIEFESQPSNMELFSETLDNTLREINSDYDAKRYKNLALVAPTIHNVSSGTFYKWMKKRGKLGGQNKVPRLCNTREYIDDILEMLQINA